MFANRHIQFLVEVRFLSSQAFLNFTYSFWLLYKNCKFYFSGGPTRRRISTSRSRKISRSDTVFEGVERFSRRTISVCLSNQEEDSDLPTVAESQAMLSDGINEDEEEETLSYDGEKEREGDHTIS